jgi:REP element-mobilizing transposase RayT
MQPKLWSYMAGIARNHGFLVLANGGMSDHVHLLIQLPPVLALAEAISVQRSRFLGLTAIGRKYLAAAQS